MEERTLLTAYSAATIGDLVADIGLANQNGGANTIALTAATGSTYTLAAALPTIAYSGSGTGSDKLTILGNGNTIDGANQYRLFGVASGNSLTLENLTLQHGLAEGTGKAAEGGAIYSSGTLALSHVTVTDNKAEGSGNSSTASGGGLYVAAGTANLRNDTLSSNTAQAGNGVTGGHGSSGRTGVHGGSGGIASGGGLFVAGGLVAVTLSNDTLSDNTAHGGNGGTGGVGGDSVNGGIGAPGGHGGVGGDAYGGGLYVEGGGDIPGGDTITLSDNILRDNTAQAGNGGAGGAGGSGGHPGAAGKGGSAYGGGVYVAAGLLTVTLSNDLLIGNAGRGGTGGTGANGGTGGYGSGGGLYMLGGAVNLINDTLTYNTAAGNSGGSGEGGGLNISGGGPNINSETVNLANTLIANNTATGAKPVGPDVDGTVASSDHDLIAKTAGSSGFSANNGDQLNVAAKINRNGTLQSGSPAINKGDSNVSPGAVDLRGYARIVGKAIDIGAYEYGATKGITDLSVTGKAAYGMPAGGEIIYRLAVKNNSAVAQSHVTLTDVLPANTTLVSWTAASGWGGSAAAAGSSGGSVSAWIASLAANTTATFTLVVKVNSGVAPGTIIANTASVGPITGDPKPGNNSITFHTTVNTGVNVSADVKVVRHRIAANSKLGVFVERVTITNTSGSPLSGPLALQLTNLPDSVTLFNASGLNSMFSAGGLSLAGAPYIDFLAPGHTLAAGESITFTLEFKALTAKSITYGAEVMQGL